MLKIYSIYVFHMAVVYTGCPRKNVAVALLQQQATAIFLLGHPVGKVCTADMFVYSNVVVLLCFSKL